MYRLVPFAEADSRLGQQTSDLASADATLRPLGTVDRGQTVSVRRAEEIPALVEREATEPPSTRPAGESPMLPLIKPPLQAGESPLLRHQSPLPLPLPAIGVCPLLPPVPPCNLLATLGARHPRLMRPPSTPGAPLLIQLLALLLLTTAGA